jgi:general secretion pathway protein K
MRAVVSPDRGSAVVAAVLASACFALIAAQVARSSRSDILSVNASLDHARLSAAADAGLALAVHGLTQTGPRGRWTADGRPHADALGEVRLSVTVEDERGKIPLNTVTAAQAAVMFRAAGAAPDAAAALVSAFIAFRDPAPDPTGASQAPARAGGFETVGELAQVPGMTQALYAAISPSATVYNGAAPFDPTSATPMALRVMQGGQSAYTALVRRRELDGETTALDASPPTPLVGRALMVRVRAYDKHGAELEKSSVIELTGRPARPVVVREQLPDFG